jgi:SAM-dependent methyltransferase
MRATRASWVRFLPVLAVAGAASFFIGTRFVVTRPPPVVHPLTGRVIPGIATDAAWLDRTERRGEEAPNRALAVLGIRPGMTVADVGAGTGYLTIPIATMVGPAGKVYANDIQPAMLGLIEAKARQQQLGNVETVRGAEDDARLPSDAIDLVLLADVYHELRQPQPMLAGIRRALRANGRLALIEYRKEDTSLPIVPTHRMSVTDIRTEIEPAGFTFEKLDESLPRQHIVIFQKAAADRWSHKN